MSEHMPCHLAVSIDAEGQQRLVIDAKDYWANGLFLSDGKFDPEDARRLAAAWNACEGMATDDIEELAECQGVMALTVYTDDILKNLNNANTRIAKLEALVQQQDTWLGKKTCAHSRCSELVFARALLRKVSKDGSLDMGNTNSSALGDRVRAYIDACDKPGEQNAS